MDQLIELIANLSTHKETAKEIFLQLGAIVLASKAITVHTPTTVDDRAVLGLGKAYNIVAKLLNVAALNVGKDKNADA